MKMNHPEENAVKFYANIFFYYSLYDGEANKTKAKSQFEQMLDRIVEEMKKYELWPEIFLICTYGGSANYRSIEQILNKKHSKVIGKFGCKGYDTFGPFKLVGGIAKRHPDEEDIKNAVEFVKEL